MRLAFYDPGTGVFNGATLEGPFDAADLVMPPGLAAWEYEMAPPAPGRWRVEGGRLVDYQPPAPPSTELLEWVWAGDLWQWVARPTAIGARAAAVVDIDAAAGRARARYITTAPGQDATYAAKFAEAVAYRNAGYPEDLTGFPYVAGESAPGADRTARDAADRIIRLGRLWGEVIGPQIEAARVNGKDRIGALEDVGAIAEVAAQVVAALDAI